MEFLRGTAGAESDKKLSAFLEHCQKAWVGMMKDQELVTFDQREQRAVDEGRLLARLLLEEQLAGDPARSPQHHNQRACCPKCGQPGEPVTPGSEGPAERVLKTRVGPARFAREQWKCTACRVVFFPLG